MSQQNRSADEKRAAERDARQQGKSASEAGASTGASKQIKTARDKDREPKGDAKT
jgi:hypothetical protein